MKEITSKFVEVCGVFIIFFIVIVIICIIHCCITSNNKNTNNPPVEGKIDVDSIIAVNDSIKININSLDSIKNAQVIEVIGLDNDSTIKLFYKLVSE